MPRVKIISQCGVRTFANGMLNAAPFGLLTAIYERNQIKSPLLRLPPELRNRIFKLAIGDSVVVMNPTWSRILHGFPSMDVMTLPALPRVCRQLYSETNMLPFATYEFRYSYGYHEEVHPGHKAFLPFQKSAISTVSIQPVDPYVKGYSPGRGSESHFDILARQLKELSGLKTIFVINSRRKFCYWLEDQEKEKATQLALGLKSLMGPTVDIYVFEGFTTRCTTRMRYGKKRSWRI
ncbi:hypothetical protein P154DRAFT_578880 [Amniculicola lignicola CBS 123094]|uniref:F-box domain-containing protein n=1 Tax=Amniculicola lignicola CBS 123094 TaxID=1392246 RepID=A0A6A5W9K3_9PLEO|nr:hypothetical protein P154DRAFT_578880 [Amniculicola lignicola CBS 123094]